MLLTPLLIIHVVAASIGLIAGFLAMSLRKGSGLHAAAGTVFVVSMLAMSSTAAFIAAFLKPVAINVVAGLLTFYLASTGWRAARYRDGKATAFDAGAMLFVLLVGVLGWVDGFRAAGSPRGMLHGMPAAAYFIFGSLALLCAFADLRMLRRGGAQGQRRIVRHLWRMSFALLIAALSLYPGRPSVFPKWLRETNLLLIPHVLLVGSMLLHRARLARHRRLKRGGEAIDAGPPGAVLTKAA